MARSHRMTPARRAALRKAQLASAKKRRKGGAVSQARKSISQRRQYKAASKSLRNTPQAKARRSQRRRKAAKTVLAVTAVAGGAAATYSVVNGHKTRSKIPAGTLKATPPRALEPKHRRIPKGNQNKVKHPSGTIFKGTRKGVLKTTRKREAYNKQRRNRNGLKKAGLYRENPSFLPHRDIYAIGS